MFGSKLRLPAVETYFYSQDFMYEAEAIAQKLHINSSYTTAY